MTPIDELLLLDGGKRAFAIRGGVVDDMAVFETGVGAIHRGRVLRILPDIGAAFVEIGTGEPALLDLTKAKLTEGDLVTVQVVEPPRADKPARVTRRVALAERTVVMLPGDRSIQWSRSLDAKARARLTAKLPKPDGCGWIVRAAAALLPDAIAREAALLRETAAALDAPPDRPGCIIPAEPIAEVIAAFAAGGVASIVIDDPIVAARVLGLARRRWPDLVARIAAAKGERLGERHEIVDALASAAARVIDLACGGRVHFDPTTALMAIDVDTGAATAARANREALPVIARQMRLRDLGGMIVVDFAREEGREEIMRRMAAVTAADRRAVQVLGFTRAGLFEMVRPRS